MNREASVLKQGSSHSAQAKPKTAIGPQKVSAARRVLMQSSSRYHNSGYLDFCDEQYAQLFDEKKLEIVFVPYAKVAGTYEGYEKQVQDAFKRYGHKIVSIHRFADPKKSRARSSSDRCGRWQHLGIGDAHVRSRHH